MSDPKFFRKYLDILNEGPPPGVGPNAPAAPAQTTAGVTNPSVDPNITKQVVASQNAQQQSQQDSAEKLAAAQERGSNVQAMQKAGVDQKTVDMYASGDLQGVANQTANAFKTLPSKADLQRMGKEAMASKEFAALPKAQQDELRATYAQADQMPDDYRQQGTANFKQVANLGAQDKADKKAGTGMYAPAAQVKSRVEPKYTEKDIQDLEANKYAPSGFAGRNIAQTVAAKPVSPTASTQTTTNLQVAKNPETGNPKLGSPLEVAPTQPTAAPAPTTTPTQQKTTTEERDDMDDRQLMRKYMDYLDEAPATAINPNDTNAASFGKQINAPGNQQPGLTAATTGSGYTNQANKPATQTNVDTRATAQRDKLAQQMSSGKVATPTSNVVDPNAAKGGGYDPSKVQYAYSGGKPAPAAPTASATQSAASDQSKLAAIGGKQQTASATQSAASDQNKANAIGNAMKTAQAAAPQGDQSGGSTTGNRAFLPGVAGGAAPESNLANQYVSANQPQTATASTTQPTSDVLATQALNAQDQGVSGQSKGIQAGFNQVAEEKSEDSDDELLKSIIRLIKQ